MEDDYVKKQMECNQQIKDNLNTIRLNVACLNEIAWDLRQVGMCILEKRITHITGNMNICLETIERADRQHTNNYMDLDAKAQTEFFKACCDFSKETP